MIIDTLLFGVCWQDVFDNDLLYLSTEYDGDCKRRYCLIVLPGSYEETDKVRLDVAM